MNEPLEGPQFWAMNQAARKRQENPQLFDRSDPTSFTSRLSLIRLGLITLNEKIDRLGGMEVLNAEQLEEFRYEFDRLESVFNELKEEMGFHVDLDLPGAPQVNIGGMQVGEVEELTRWWEGNRRLGGVITKNDGKEGYHPIEKV